MEFYPPLRNNDNPKVLAGSETMAGVYIMDVFPEETVLELRRHMKWPVLKKRLNFLKKI